MEQQPRSLREALESYTVDDLKSMARVVASSLPTRKAEIVGLIHGKLTGPGFLRSFYEGLTEAERNVVREAVHAGGAFNAEAYVAKYGERPRLASDHRSGRNQAAALKLLLHGDQIMPDLLRLLREFVPAPEEFVLPGKADAPETWVPKEGEPVPLLRADAEQAAIHDVLAVLELARAGKLSVGEKTGVPGAAALRALTPRLLLPDYLTPDLGVEEVIRPYGLIMGAQMGGLVRAAGPRLQLTRAGEAFLRDPSPARLRDAWERYLGADKPDELRRIGNLKGQQSRQTHLSPPSERKRCIVEALGRCPIGEWIAVDEFLRALRAWNLSFPMDVGGFTGLYVGWSAEYGWLGGFSIDTFWVLQAPYTLAVLWEYAASYGVVDVLYTSPEETDWPRPDYFEEDYFSRYQGLHFFRINYLGAHLLRRTEEYTGPAQAEEPAAFTVLPNLEVAVTDPARLAPNDRAFLERVAVPGTEGVFRLDREKMLAAVEDGLAIETVAGFLERRGAKGVPQPVSRFLDDLRVASQALGAPAPALLIPCRDAHVCELITHDSVLRSLCLAAGGDTHVAVPVENEAAFRRRLRKLGYAIPPR